MEEMRAPWVLLFVLAAVAFGDDSTSVFVEQPVPVAAAPFGSQVRLRCSVIEGYGIDWEIRLPSDPDVVLSTGSSIRVQLLRNEGIEVVPSSSLTNSILVINETSATATCVALQIDAPSECRSMSSQVIFHGPPTVPFDLSVMENGLGSLNVSWSHATTEGVAVDFTLTATNLNDSNIVVMGIEDLHQTLTIQDNMSCDVYSFIVTARNAAGSSSPSDTLTSSFPALPDISTVECSLDHSLREVANGITLNVTLTDVTSCPEYPVHNYTLVVVDSEGNRTTQTSQATGDVVNIAISGLRENLRYSYHVIATNQFGDSNRSTPVEIVTTDVQGISICRVEGNTYSIRCSYLSGSDADECGYILVSGMDGMENVTGRIETDEREEVLKDLEISSFSELLGFDLDSTEDLFITSAVRNIALCHSKGCPSDAATLVLTSAISVIVTALLATVIFVLVQIALCKCYPKFTPGGAETGTSAGGEGQEYEEVDGGGGTYMEVGGGGGGGGNTFQLKKNEAYASRTGHN